MAETFAEIRFQTLSEDEKEAARRFRELWEQRKKEATERGQKLTDTFLCQVLDCSPASITGYKNGRMRIDMETAVKLAKALRVRPEDIHPQIERLALEVRVDAKLLRELTVLVNEKLSESRFKATDRVKAEIIADLYAEALRRELKATDAELVRMTDFTLHAVQAWAK